MAANPITVPLPQDLPTNWAYGQTIGPAGTDVGLTQQHGYNYLMAQVNAAQQAAEEIGSAIENIDASGIPTSDGSNVQSDLNLKANLSDHQLMTYTSLEELDLSGAVTTVQAFSAISDKSTLQFYSSTSDADWISDSPVDNCNIMIHRDGGIGYCYAYRPTYGIFYGECTGGSSDPTFSGWEKVVVTSDTSGNIVVQKQGQKSSLFLVNTPNGAASLQSGSASASDTTAILYGFEVPEDLPPGTIVDNDNYTALYLCRSDTPDINALRLVRKISGSISTYPIYGTHNITVSQNAPASSLSNGAICMVY